MGDLKLDASLLEGPDAELDVPKACSDGAERRKKKEHRLRALWEPREFRDTTLLRERYPSINLRYERAGTRARGMQVLVAPQRGPRSWSM
jgi:hypothetical protein